MFKSVCVSIATVVFASTGFAQVGSQAPTSLVLNFETPFAFHIGERELPAGSYTARRTPAGFAIVNGNGGAAVVMTNLGAQNQNGSAPANAQLVFNKYGNTYFLSQMWYGERTEGIQTVKTRKEREMVTSKVQLAQGGLHRVAILASLR